MTQGDVGIAKGRLNEGNLPGATRSKPLLAVQGSLYRKKLGEILWVDLIEEFTEGLDLFIGLSLLPCGDLDSSAIEELLADEDIALCTKGDGDGIRWTC